MSADPYDAQEDIAKALWVMNDHLKNLVAALTNKITITICGKEVEAGRCYKTPEHEGDCG